MRCALPVLAPLLLVGCAMTPDAEASRFPARLAGLGTEPFWTIALDGETLRYASPETPTQTARVTRRISRGMLELSGTFAGQPLRASIRRERCSDGMSDRSYPLAVALAIAGLQLAGCAYPGSTPPPG